MLSPRTRSIGTGSADRTGFRRRRREGVRLAAAVQVASCRRTGYGRLLAALLTGVACCVPTFLLVLGSTAAVVLPVVVPLRILFYPLSLVLLAATLVWGTRRL